LLHKAAAQTLTYTLLKLLRFPTLLACVLYAQYRHPPCMSLEPGPGGLIRLTEHLALVARPVIPFCLDPRDSQCQSGSAYFEILIRSGPKQTDLPFLKS